MQVFYMYKFIYPHHYFYIYLSNKKTEVKKVILFKFAQLKSRYLGVSLVAPTEVYNLPTNTGLLLFAIVQGLLIAYSTRSKLLRGTRDPLMTWLLFVLPASFLPVFSRNKHTTWSHRKLYNFPCLPNSFRPANHWSHFPSS